MFYKPTHTKNYATDRGWVAESNGELLTSHRGLLDKLTKLGLDKYGNKKKIVSIKKEEPKVEEKIEEKEVSKTTKRITKKK